MTYWQLERPSKRSGKKWQVRVPTSSGRGVTVRFGDAKMSDYTLHKDKARRERYRTRHQRDRIDDPYAPGFWSWWSLWGESSDLDKAHAAAVKRAKKILGVKKDAEGNEVATLKTKSPRKNPNPPGTPSPTLAEAAEVVAVLDVPKNLRAEFLKGLATEWEHAHTVDYDLVVVGGIVLDHLAEDPHYYRKLRRARLNPSDDKAPSSRVQSCFDALLAGVQEQYPSLRCTIEVDESAGERGGHACNRAYAFCEDLDDGAFRIAVAGKLNDADDSRVEGLLRHELAHAVLLHTGDLEHTERDADDVAEALFSSPLFYDEEDVQTTDPSAPGARRPRPAYLDDANGRTLDSPDPTLYDHAQRNPMHQLETVEDVASCLDDCAVQGDAKTPRMLASQFSQQSKQVAGAQARMLLTLAKAARHCANGIEARLAGEVDRAMTSERMCDAALQEAAMPRSRRNPSAWQKAMRGTASTKSKSKWKVLSVEEIREGTSLLEVDTGSGIHRITVYPDGFVQSGTLRLSPEQQEKARKEVAKRENPEWAKKLGSGLYKGARYAGETARDVYHGAREAHRAHAAPVEGERKNPRRRAAFGDDYKYFIVDLSGEPESGWEYREDAKDALRDGSSGRPGLRIVGRSSVDKQKLADFFARNRNNPHRAAHAAHAAHAGGTHTHRLPGIGTLTVRPDPQGGRDVARVEVTKAFTSEWDHDMLNHAYLSRDVMGAVEKYRHSSNFYAVDLVYRGRVFTRLYPSGSGI